MWTDLSPAALGGLGDVSLANYERIMGAGRPTK